MGSAASKSAASGAKSAARQFPSAANIAAQERAAAAAASAARAARESAAGGVGGDFERKERKENLTSSPKLDYLAEQRKLEEQIAKYDEAIQKSKHHDGGSRPYEDTPSAAELEFFGNLKTVGQVQVHNPDQIKHHEAEQALKRKLPSKTPSTSSTTTSSSLPSSQQPRWTSATTESAATAAGATLTSLKLMQLLQARNQDPSDAKGRESGVWCEDLRGVTVVDKAKEAEAERRAAGLAPKEEVASKEKKGSSKRS
ncbi:hypothetical protein BG005_004115 [Podila minutissima]|nr:hypothetical protein BG005_004115 [Podila minutissima]